MSDEIVTEPDTAPSEETSLVGTVGTVGTDGGAGPVATLVEIENGLAVLFGDHVPEGLEVVPFTLIDTATRSAMSAVVAGSFGAGNVVAQGVNGVLQAQGLVRLAPQTIKALKTMTPVVKDGWNLGTLGVPGRFGTAVRWLPASAATATSVIASMGQALTLMAIQVQLNQIANVAQHNVELTSKVMELVRQKELSTVIGYHKTLIRELGHARQIGEVTSAVFEEIRGYQGELSNQWDFYETAVRRHAKELESKLGHKERQQYLTDHGQAIVADIHALLLAKASWFVYDALRAGHLLKSAKSNSQDEMLLRTLVSNAKSLHAKTLDETDWLLDQLSREFAVISELPGKRTIKIGSTSRAAKDATALVRQLQQALVSIRGEDTPKEPEPLVLPSILVFEGEVPSELERILPLRLRTGERVLALGDASCSRWNLPFLDSGWVVVTDQRVLITKQDSLRRVGAIDTELAVDDIRYVRRSDQTDKATTVEVITKDITLTLKFPSWSKTGQSRTDAQRLGELVASYMRLPDSEVPKVERRELDAAVDQAANASIGAGASASTHH
ncbi:hypothetical protein [Cryobacterium sp. Hh38]|uniref:hypothetical protein n=1 Tax=Cryobacterium sp. Hh38 TaxID=1259156 RepID=UPI00106BE96B|nr:hypothetical protein [Cryobacterium sp. Hh38]TFD66084.1 hypothetical protein E3T41_00045 [Cryobacterium sp. Hh38]